MTEVIWDMSRDNSLNMVILRVTIKAYITVHVIKQN